MRGFPLNCCCIVGRRTSPSLMLIYQVDTASNILVGGNISQARTNWRKQLYIRSWEVLDVLVSVGKRTS